jgi:hypothetical protein
MTDTSAEARFRQAAEAEGGMPVSAGARRVHVRPTAKAGAIFSIEIDLSGVSEEKVQSVLAEIREVVNRALTRTPSNVPSSSR